MHRPFAARIAAFALLAAAVCAAPAAAFEVSPMIYDLAPSGPDAAQNVRVTNPGQAALTIEVTAERRIIDENGQESRQPADDLFVLFPPQAVVPPGSAQTVRVQYVGPADLTASETFLVSINQVPVALEPGQSGVQFVFNFSTVANVVPAGAAAKVEVESVAPTAEGLLLTVRNSGTKYTNLGGATVTLREASGFAATLEGEPWREVMGPNWLLPGNRRIFKLPRPEGAPAGGSWTATFVLPPAG